MKSFRIKPLFALFVTGALLLGLAGAASAAKAPATQPAAQPAAAAAPAPAFVVPVEIRDFTADALGTTLVQRTRDAFADDRRFLITATEPNRILVRLYTRGITSKDLQTAYSFTVTYKVSSNAEEMFIGNTIGTCTVKEVPADAKGIVGMTWDQLNNFPNILEKVKKK